MLPILFSLIATTSTTAEVREELRDLARTASTATAAAPFEDIVLSPPRPEQLTFSLVYTGASYGIGSGRYDFELPERIEQLAKEAGEELTSVLAYHGAGTQGLAVIVAADRRVKTLVDMLTEGSISCGEPRPALSVRSPRDRLLYAGDLDRYPPWIAKLEGRVTRKEYEARSCKSPSGHAAVLYTPVRARFVPPSWKLEEIEIRLALHLEIKSGDTIREAELIGIPDGEPSRRFRLLDTLAHRADTLYVDTGSFVDGASSVRDGALSIYRPLGFELLARLEPAALVPGETELIAGAQAFLADARAHRLDYVATNWSAADPQLELPELLIRDLVTAQGVVRVAFLGILDPRLRDQLPGLADEGVTIDDPLGSAERVVRALRDHETPPDVIIALTSAGPEVTEGLEQRLHGVDLIIGDPDEETGRLRHIDLDLRPDIDERRSIAATLPLFGIQAATLDLYERSGTYALRRVRVQPHRTTESIEPDARTLAYVTKTRADFYPQLDRPLLDVAEGGPLARFSRRDWRKLICESVLSRTDADLVILPALPPADYTPGPLTELLVANRLAVLDRLESHWIPGSKMHDLLRQAGEFDVTACGATIGTRAQPLIRGRLIEPEAFYRIVTTDRARVLGLAKIFEPAYSRRALDARGPDPILDDEGARVTLRKAVLDELRARRESSEGYASAKPLLVDSVAVKPARWLLRVAKLAFRVERFKGANDEAFSRVPETLATSPSSLSLTGDADVALAYDGASLIADLRLRSQYSRLVVGEAPVQEPADDLRISSSASFPVVAMPLGSLKLMPFTEVLLDSEITRIEQDGMKLPRQADLSLTIGLSLVPISFVKLLRVGGFVLGDLARSDRPAEVGGRAEWLTQYIFGPELRFETTADATLFAGTSQDDASDLRFKSLLEGRLALPVARFLDVSLFARTFIFAGRVPETDRVRASYMLGASLDLHGVFRL